MIQKLIISPIIIIFTLTAIVLLGFAIVTALGFLIRIKIRRNRNVKKSIVIINKLKLSLRIKISLTIRTEKFHDGKKLRCQNRKTALTQSSST